MIICISALTGMLFGFFLIWGDIVKHGKKFNYNCVLCDCDYCPAKYCWNQYKELNKKDKE